MPKTSSSSAQRRRTAERLHSSALRLLRRLRLTDHRTGIGPARLSALSVLTYAGDQTLGDLATLEDVRPPTMTRIVQGLEEDGLITRRRDPEDGRVSRVSATPRGRTVLEKGRQLRVTKLLRLMRGLSAQEVKTLGAAARILRDMLR